MEARHRKYPWGYPGFRRLCLRDRVRVLPVTGRRDERDKRKGGVVEGRVTLTPQEDLYRSSVQLVAMVRIGALARGVRAGRARVAVAQWPENPATHPNTRNGMTTPEENAPKTDDTDQVVMKPGDDPDRDPDQEPKPRPDTRTEMGAALADKMSEKGLSRDDFS
jgi:hypothetical protein